LALLADIISVVVFCTVGRRSHAEGRTAAGIAETAWPFLAGAFMNWLEGRFRHASDRESGPLLIMYGIDGRECLPEEELAHLEGYMGSAPVRIGNGAATQLQLDVYGELMDSVYLCNKLGLLISIHQSLGGVEQSGVSLADKLDGVGPAFGRRRALLPWRHPAKNGTRVARLVRGRMGTPCCKFP
jgi:hypothetical protein